MTPGALPATAAVRPPVLERGHRSRGLRRSVRRHWQLYLLLLVPIACFVVFKYIPMANAVIAFKDYNVVDGVWGSDWAGSKHFERFFSNPMFWPVAAQHLRARRHTCCSQASRSRSSWRSR